MGKIKQKNKTVTKSKKEGEDDVIEYKTLNLNLHKCSKCKKQIKTDEKDGLNFA